MYTVYWDSYIGDIFHVQKIAICWWGDASPSSPPLYPPLHTSKPYISEGQKALSRIFIYDVIWLNWYKTFVANNEHKLFSDTINFCWNSCTNIYHWFNRHKIKMKLTYFNNSNVQSATSIIQSLCTLAIWCVSSGTTNSSNTSFVTCLRFVALDIIDTRRYNLLTSQSNQNVNTTKNINYT